MEYFPQVPAVGGSFTISIPSLHIEVTMRADATQVEIEEALRNAYTAFGNFDKQIFSPYQHVEDIEQKKSR